VYGEYVGLFNIDTLEMIEGDLPKRAKKLVIEWATINKDLNFLTCVARRHDQDIRAWPTAALTAERITTTVIRGGHLGAAHDVRRE